MKHEFKPTSETVTAEYKGKTYYFCCPGCDEKFAADPEKYVSE
ncbi:MAG: YHS domain-containing protein [Deltaproteobacteria bacterium]|nr:YHS domain-containing protein [Deltaproteobacteria bacterium]